MGRTTVWSGAPYKAPGGLGPGSNLRCVPHHRGAAVPGRLRSELLPWDALIYAGTAHDPKTGVLGS